MTRASRHDVTPGTKVWLDGAVWTVQSLDALGVELFNGRSAKSISLSRLASSAIAIGDAEPDGDGELIGVLLGSLTARERTQLEERARHVREILAEAAGGSRKITSLREQKARELGVSAKTVQRWMAGYQDAGVAGLADRRLLGRRAVSIDPRWDAMCLRILRQLAPESTPTVDVVIRRVAAELAAEHGDDISLPSTATAYRRIKQLSKGSHAFGSGKARRSVAERPKGAYGRLRATRPGEYAVLDTTPLDVFAMEPVTLRWVPVELTVCMDLYTRCILGLRLTPVSTKSQDVANVLYQSVTPQFDVDRGDESGWPFHGVPRNVLVSSEEPDGVSQERVGGLPACVPESIVVDHGKQYLSAHVIGVCARFGISVQPAIPHKPTDKPTVERFFRTLRESLLQHLPAYKGPDVYSRGKDVEDKAFYYVSELEQIIREWVGSVYHHSKHSGLCVPQLPGERFSPAEMFEIGLARSGSLALPTRPDLAYEFLDVVWRTIQHYGVEINGQRYNGPALNHFRNIRSPYGGVNAGKWPFSIDTHDVRFVCFQDPDTRQWHRLDWEHAPDLKAPFSQDAADYAKRVSVRAGRHVDPGQAVQDLIGQWSRDEVLTRRERSLARRISSQRNDIVDSDSADAVNDDARDVASLPTVIDLATRRSNPSGLDVVDDFDDVFERYYSERPDEEAFEVFDE